jgi:hypothetical protein
MSTGLGITEKLFIRSLDNLYLLNIKYNKNFEIAT